MAISVYMNFKGNAKSVIEYYQDLFKVNEAEIMYFKDMPPSEAFPITEVNKEMVMHGELKIDDFTLMFSDVPPDSPQTLDFGNNITLMYSSDDYDLLKSYFEQIAKEGQVIMPFEATFWSKGYGMVTDKYGIGWQFNCNEA